jgi:hypothetical protein
VNIREPEVAPLETEGELFVVQPEQMKNRGVEIVDVRPVLHGSVPQLICLADDRLCRLTSLLIL